MPGLVSATNERKWTAVAVWIRMDGQLSEQKVTLLRDPLRLLNEPEEARAYFAQEIAEAAALQREPVTDDEVAEQVDLATGTLAAIRRVFEVLEEAGHTEEPDQQALQRATEELNELLKRIAPWQQTGVRVASVAYQDGERESHTRVGRSPNTRNLTLAWRVAPVVPSPRPVNAWDHLIEMLTEAHFGETAPYLVCPVCRLIMRRRRRDQVFCSPRCRKRAYDLKRGIGPLYDA